MAPKPKENARHRQNKFIKSAPEKSQTKQQDCFIMQNALAENVAGVLR
jgi:hypothetical protein